MPRLNPRWISLAATGLAIAVLFTALNRRAVEGYFQDDELQTLTWAPLLGAKDYLLAIVTPLSSTNNFRPTAHLYFTVMGDRFGLNFAPWIPLLFGIHLLNGLLLFLLMRKLTVRAWQAMAGTAVFILSAAAFDAYWKPMYIYDLVCTTLALASVLLYARRRWILSFVAFWLAYKAKELAVALPLVLALWEYWFGEKRFFRLIPFFAAALSFGLQGYFLNPNRHLNNEYTFNLSVSALRQTIPFYARRFLMFRWSGLAILLLAFIRDKRIWFGQAGMALLIAILLFLPGRRFEAYIYLPFAFAVIALAAASSRMNPLWAWAVVMIWLPFNFRQLNREIDAKLAADARIAAFVDPILAWSAAHPNPTTLVYNGIPDPGFHDWGVAAAWILAHNRPAKPVPALWFQWPDGVEALRERAVVWGAWDGARLHLSIRQPTP